MEKIEMYGTGNFVIDKTLYAFRQYTRLNADGSEDVINTKVTPTLKKHIPMLEAESARRKTLVDKVKKVKKDARA